eukprot:jgi/Bigna1/79540/fgenesh1_pg.63_\
MAFKSRIAKENNCIDTWESKYRQYFPRRRWESVGAVERMFLASRDSRIIYLDKHKQQVQLQTSHIGVTSLHIGISCTPIAAQEYICYAAERKPVAPAVVCPKVGTMKVVQNRISKQEHSKNRREDFRIPSREWRIRAKDLRKSFEEARAQRNRNVQKLACNKSSLFKEEW